MPPILASALILAFLASPFFITHVLSPRDLLKYPFAVVVGGLLIGAGAMLRTPARFLGFACAVGALIGIGYGFRSDLYIFLLPAALIVALLGRLDLSAVSLSPARDAVGSLLIRVSAVAALLASFCIGGWAPLFNDGYFHQHADDVGYHVMVMGLYGNNNRSLYQSNAPNGEMYMFRNNYGNDLAAGVRIMEYGRRHGGEVVDFKSDAYWGYSKQYYLDVVSLIPADLLSRAIGAFINMMTLPTSAATRPPMVNNFDLRAPWAGAYDFARGTAIYDRVVLAVDKFYAAASNWRTEYVFLANMVVLFAFLCLLVQKFGPSSAITAIRAPRIIALSGTMLVDPPRYLASVVAEPVILRGAHHSSRDAFDGDVAEIRNAPHVLLVHLPPRGVGRGCLVPRAGGSVVACCDHPRRAGRDERLAGQVPRGGALRKVSGRNARRRRRGIVFRARDGTRLPGEDSANAGRRLGRPAAHPGIVRSIRNSARCSGYPHVTARHVTHPHPFANATFGWRHAPGGRARERTGRNGRCRHGIRWTALPRPRGGIGCNRGIDCSEVANEILAQRVLQRPHPG